MLLLLVLTRAEARLVQEFVWQMDATDVAKLVAAPAENPNAIACYIARNSRAGLATSWQQPPIHGFVLD